MSSFEDQVVWRVCHGEAIAETWAVFRDVVIVIKNSAGRNIRIDAVDLCTQRLQQEVFGIGPKRPKTNHPSN